MDLSSGLVFGFDTSRIVRGVLHGSNGGVLLVDVALVRLPLGTHPDCRGVRVPGGQGRLTVKIVVR